MAISYYMAVKLSRKSVAVNYFDHGYSLLCGKTLNQLYKDINLLYKGNEGNNMDWTRLQNLA